MVLLSLPNLVLAPFYLVSIAETPWFDLPFVSENIIYSLTQSMSVFNIVLNTNKREKKL